MKTWKHPCLGASLLMSLSGTHASELFAADRVAARRALVAQVGPQAASSYALSEQASGCDFERCTDIVTRRATFVRDLPERDNVRLRGEVDCWGYREADWTCHAEWVHASFTLDGEPQTTYLRNIPPGEAVAVASFMRSDCHRASLQASPRSHALPRWAADPRLPIRTIQQASSGKITVHMGYDGLGLIFHLGATPQAKCPFVIEDFTSYVV